MSCWSSPDSRTADIYDVVVTPPRTLVSIYPSLQHRTVRSLPASSAREGDALRESNVASRDTLRWSVFPQASHSIATKDISTQVRRCPSILPPARCLRVLSSMAPPYEILDALPAGGLLPELEQWLPPDKTLGAYLLGTFVGAMYVG